MGKRRARCLRKLGVESILALDPREDRRAEIAAQSGVETFAEWHAAREQGVDFVLLCAPPHLHFDWLMRCIEAGLPVFCESPLTLTLEEADAVIAAAARNDVFVAPSCTYLHNPIHRIIKQYLDDERFGRPLAALSHVGQHVADWHPYEDYRNFYASKRAQGGMCFDMLPHDLHLFTWYFGGVKSMASMARRRAAEIESDAGACDVYDVLLDMEAGITLNLHQDVFQRPWGVYRKIMCERGAIEWDWHSLRVCPYAGPQFHQTPSWEAVPLPGYEFESMYLDEIAHALRAFEGKEPYLMPPEEDRALLAWALACE